MPDTTKPSATPTSLSTGTGQAAAAHTVSVGAVGGIAVGCAIGGALIAFLILRLVRPRRKRTGQSLSVAQPRQPPLLSSVAQQQPPPSSWSIIEDYLPQPEEDDEVQRRFGDLCVDIRNHVQLYSLEPLHRIQVDGDLLRRIGYDDSQIPSAEELAQLLHDPTNRADALRYVIAWVILRRMEFDGDPNTTLLPAEFVHCLRFIRDSVALRGWVRSIFVSKWRILTARLLVANWRDFAPDEALLGRIEEIIRVFLPVLESFVKEGNKGKCVEDLRRIMLDASKFAFLLFSQASKFDMNWNTEGWVRIRELSVSPILHRHGEGNNRTHTGKR